MPRSPHSPPRLPRPLGRLVGAVQRRLRLQRAAAWGLRAAAVGLAAWAATVVASKLLLAPGGAVWAVAWAAAGLALGGALVGFARRVGQVEAAARLDDAGDLADRLSSAAAFATLPARTPLMEAAVADAAQAAASLEPRLAAPWRCPRWLGWAALAAGLAAGAYVLPWPRLAVSGAALARLSPPPLRARRAAALRPEDRRRLTAEAQEVARQRTAPEARDPFVQRWLGQLNELLRALREDQLTAEEASAALAKLESERDAWAKEHTDGAPEALDRLGEAADEAAKRGRSKDLQDTLAALRARDAAEAARALERAARKLGDEDRSAREGRGLNRKARRKRGEARRRAGKDLKRLAKALETERQRRQRAAQRDRDRLQRKRDRLRRRKRDPKARLNRRDRDRLQRTRRRLEELRRERQRMSEAGRQLERLQRELAQAARDLQRRGGGAGDMPPPTAEQLRQAAELMRRLAQRAGQAQSLRVARARMVDVREMLRRAGRGAGAGQGQGQGKGQGQGQAGGGAGEGDQRERFLRLARGGGGQQGAGQGKDGVTLLQPGGGGRGAKAGSVLLPGQGGQGGQGSDPSSLGGPGGEAHYQGGGQGEGGEGGAGDGVGVGHDGQPLGAKTKLAGAKARARRVSGRQGAGPAATRVVMTAAARGFATRAYKDVHQDYAGVVEDALDRQKIPAGKRRYVRRYFDLIRPR